MKKQKVRRYFIFKLMVCVMALSILTPLGCISKNTKSHSGFLNDYSTLKSDPLDKKNAVYWQHPDVQLKNYKKFIVDPISFYVSPAIQDDIKNIDPERVNKMTAYFREAIITTLIPEYTVVNEVGPDVIRLRIALTSVEVNRQKLKAYQYLPAALVITTAKEAAGRRDRTTIVTMEGEALESLTGKRIVAIVQSHGTEVSAKEPAELSEGEIYPLLDFWAKKMKNRLLYTK